MEERLNNTNLSNQQYLVVLYDHKENLSTKKIAEKMDVDRSTVRTARRKAKVKMNKAQRTVELMNELDIESH